MISGDLCRTLRTGLYHGQNRHTKIEKKRSKFKEREENGKKRHKKNSSLYCSLHGENKSHTSKECTVLKGRTKDKENTKYLSNYYKSKFKEVNILDR